MMTLRIPIDIEDDTFAMACYYKEDGTLEPILMSEMHSDELVLGVSHFSDIVVTAIKKTLLDDYVKDPSVNSGFIPGVDNWSFTNYGSQISEGGMCQGMTISAIYYYQNHKLKGEESLHTYLDNNHGPLTEDFWQDDSMGIRLTSMVQENSPSDQYDEWIINYVHSVELLSDKQIFYHFAYSFMLSDGAPQGVSLFVRENKDSLESAGLDAGHAIIAHAIDENGIYVCDPNYPEATDLVIPFDGENFGIYDTSTVSGGAVYQYNSFAVIGVSTLYSDADLKALFEEAEEDPYESSLGDSQFDNPDTHYYVLENGSISQKTNISRIELEPEQMIGYKKKIEKYLEDLGEHLPSLLPADWDTKDYICVGVTSGNDLGEARIYIDNMTSYSVSKADKLIFYNFIPLEEGINNYGVEYNVAYAGGDGNFIDFTRTTVTYGEVDLSGVWEGYLEITDYSKAMDYIEKIQYAIMRMFVQMFSAMLDQQPSEAEIDRIIKESLAETEAQLETSLPMRIVLTNKVDNTYDALVSWEGDSYYEFETVAEYDGEVLSFSHDDPEGAHMDFQYFVDSNDRLEGAFQMDYGAIGDFITGITDMKKISE